MMQYLSKFCPLLSETMKPLREISNESSEFKWEKPQQDAYEKCEQLATEAPTLAHFDTNKPILLQVDASDFGLGCVLLQKGKPVFYHSCKMKEREKPMAQIEKECLAINAAFDKWDQFLFGHGDITVHTDHQPLETIFEKPLQAAPKRLQKMRLQLQRYSFEVKYKPGKTLHIADTLSRAPRKDKNNTTQTEFDVFRLDIIETNLITPRISDQTYGEVLQAAVQDVVYIKLGQVIKSGWPENKQKLDKSLHPYWDHRDTLSIDENGVITKAKRMVIPEKLRPKMLSKLHTQHLADECTKRLGRDLIFWPNMGAQIEDMCSKCEKCAIYKRKHQKEPMMSHSVPDLPWQYVSQDLLDFKKIPYLVTVDHYSDFV